MKKGNNITLSTLQEKVQSMRKKKVAAGSSSTQTVERSVQETTDHLPTPTENTQLAEIDTMPPTVGDSEVPDIRRRVRNKNFALNKLTSRGEKVLIYFDTVGKTPICESRNLWSRHIGMVVRQDSIIPHCTESWKKLTPSTIENLWQAVIDKFDAENIDQYRDATLRHMKARWEDWRHDINVKHIKPHESNSNAIKLDCPPGMEQTNWEWLLSNYYLTDKYKLRSATNTENKKKTEISASHWEQTVLPNTS